MQEDVAEEAETGKIYRSNYTDKHGRTVLVMRPARQVNSKKSFPRPLACLSQMF